MAANDAKVPVQRKRWYQFRLRTLLGVICLACLVFAWPHIRKQYAFWQLKTFVDRDFDKLSDKDRESAESLVDSITEPWSLTAKGPRFPLFGFDTWRVLRRSSSNRQQQFSVIQIEQAMSIPGVSRARIYHLDGVGNVTGKLEFNAGYRSFVDKVEFDERSRGFPCLMIETHHTDCGRTRQYYFVSANHVELIRCETLDGELFTHAGNSFDPYDTLATRETWRKLIKSDVRADCLRGLGHLWSLDVSARIKLDDELRLDLQRLACSSDLWISESACIALEQLSERAARMHELRPD
jgi:hypothetical protein